MEEANIKRSIWMTLCDELETANRTFSDEGASLFIGVLTIDTIVDLDEDPSEIADAMESELKQLFADSMDDEFGTIHVSVRTDGDELGIAIVLDPSTYDDTKFAKVALTIKATLGEYLA